MFKKILVGVDGSEQSLHAAKMAGDLARLMNSDLYVVVAYDPLPHELSEQVFESTIGSRISKAEATCMLALQECGDLQQRKVTREILEGPPAEAILSVAESREIDLIVMGTRGLGRIASLILGSQSAKVGAEASCPVLLVR